MQNQSFTPKEIRLTVIGHVETSVPDHEIAKRRRDLVSDVVILPQYLPALTGIDDYSHLIILFIMEATESNHSMKGYPRGDTRLPLTGVLAMRGRAHPNPIGLAVVDLVGRSDDHLHVRRLDAYHGTPVIDIKPYDYYDSYTELRVPKWVQERRASSNSPVIEW